MRTGWQGLGVRGKQVGKVPAAPAVAVGQGLPEPSGRGGIAPAQHPGHHAPAGPLDGQPEPDFASPTAHKRPHFIQFKHFPLLALRFFRPQARQGRAWLLRFFLPAWPRSCAKHPSRARCYAASCARPVAARLARTVPPAQPRPARSGLGGRRRCSGSGRARRCAHCGECAHCRIGRTYIESLPSAVYEVHPELDHRRKFYS